MHTDHGSMVSHWSAPSGNCRVGVNTAIATSSTIRATFSKSKRKAENVSQTNSIKLCTHLQNNLLLTTTHHHSDYHHGSVCKSKKTRLSSVKMNPYCWKNVSHEIWNTSPSHGCITKGNANRKTDEVYLQWCRYHNFHPIAAWTCTFPELASVFWWVSPTSSLQ